MKQFIKKQVVYFVKPRLSAVFYKKLRFLGQTVFFSAKSVNGKLKRLFIKPSFPVNEEGRINLHLGCGDIDAPGFINIDAVPKRHVHYVRPIDDLRIFKNESVDFIFASHCLEHFSHRDVLSVLTEWYRVLKTGGALCISVPDFNLLLDIYFSNGKNLNLVQGYLMGGQDYKYNFHNVLFNQENLSELLYRVGFSIVRSWTPYADELHSVAGFADGKAEVSGNKYPISLNLEAIK